MDIKKIKKYDDKGNLIYKKYSNSHEYWYKYDENNNCVYYKNSLGSGYENWQKYDENNNIIHYKSSNGTESWCKYDKKGRTIYITEKEYKEIEFRKWEKEYLSREKCSRFELMEI